MRRRLPGTMAFSLLTAALAASTVLSTGAARAATTRYVALGDSYTAGPLISVPTGDPLLCLRSKGNYPSLLAHDLSIGTFVDASCSGATTADTTGSQDLGVESAPPQFDALTADTTLVTVQFGGNDIGFGSIIVECASLSVTDPFGDPCTRHYTKGGTDRLAAEIAATAPKVAAVLRGVHQRAPHARVYVVGYLRILPRSGGCWPVVPVSSGDLPYLNGVETKLNAMLATEAAAGGATYVSDDAAGHDACRPESRKWVEGIIPTSPSAPIHPNERGMIAVANNVESAIGRTTSSASTT